MKPIARNTPYSCVRSRTLIAIVFARMSVMINRIASDTMSKALSTAENAPRNDSWNARSLIVSVWSSFSSNFASTALAMSALLLGSSMRSTSQPT